MNSARLKTALKQLGAWSLVATFIALLTIIFSFLGALFCAALGGMMMGATKTSKALCLGFSALCPAVLLMTLRTHDSELTQRQVFGLAALCCGAFWGLYLVSLLVVAYEKTDSPRNTLAVSEARPAAHRVEPPMADGFPAPTTLRLEQLEGKWCCEICANDGQRQQRVLEIRDGALALSTFDEEGRMCSCTRGRVKLDEVSATRSRSLAANPELAAGI
jgi:hypothetical protein